ncbi:DUF2029 domain-containing protein [Candidatus Microgenomates bacterium]|nr:DUF2029 domain-containing protein [Candidatus Microgenomates bacterium]
MIFLKLLEPLGADFVVYYEAAKVFLAGANPYLGLITRTFPFNYPPTALLFLWPLALFDFATANIVWNILSTVSVVLSIVLIYELVRLFRPAAPARTATKLISLILLFTIFFFPVKFDIGNGQINHFILLFCSLALYLYHHRRKTWSAFFLAFAIGIKVAPAIFILYFIIRRDWQMVCRVAVTLLILFGISLLFITPSFQLVYLRDVLPLSFTTGAKDWYYNQSLWGFLSRSLPSSLSLYLFFPLALLILSLTWRRGRVLPWRRSLAAVSCLYLLIHPIALQHYFGFAIIPIILLLSRRDWKVLASAYLLLAIDIKNFAAVPKEFNFILSHDFYGVLILWTLALWREKILQIISAYWVVIVVLIYVLSLACRAGYC